MRVFKTMGHVASRLCVAADVETVVVVIRDDDPTRGFSRSHAQKRKRGARSDAARRRGVRAVESDLNRKRRQRLRLARGVVSSRSRGRSLKTFE